MSKPSMKQFRGKKASLWQSAVDRVAASAPVASPAAGLNDEAAAPPSGRTPPQGEEAAATLASADAIAAMLDQGATPAIPPPPIQMPPSPAMAPNWPVVPFGVELKT